MPHLTISTANAEYQIIQALKMNRNKRARMNEIFIEGIESIKQAISAQMTLTRIITYNYDNLSDWAKDVTRAHKTAKVIEMSYALYESLCDREEPTELLVTAGVTRMQLGDLDLPGNPFVLIFDRPSDHGNFGALLRSANSFNVDAVLVVGHGIDYYDPKVIRASMGSVFHSNIVNIRSMVALEEWIEEQKKKSGMVIVGTDSKGEISLLTHPLKKPIAIILGNEAKGMSVALKNACDYIASIPISGDVNSLNVSCSGTIFLWDVYRNSKIG